MIKVNPDYLVSLCGSKTKQLMEEAIADGWRVI
jgi:hypothetical protein